MTTAHHPTSTTAGSHRGLDVFGTLLVALPLIAGVVAALVALTGRLGGPENALTAAWYVPTVLGWLPLAGAALLLLVHRHDHLTKPLAAWAAVAAGGWVFGIGSAQVTGLADASSMDGMAWRIALLAIGIGAYLVGLVGLTATGLKAGTPYEEPYY